MKLLLKWLYLEVEVLPRYYTAMHRLLLLLQLCLSLLIEELIGDGISDYVLSDPVKTTHLLILIDHLVFVIGIQIIVFFIIFFLIWLWLLLFLVEAFEVLAEFSQTIESIACICSCNSIIDTLLGNARFF